MENKYKISEKERQNVIDKWDEIRTTPITFTEIWDKYKKVIPAAYEMRPGWNIPRNYEEQEVWDRNKVPEQFWSYGINTKRGQTFAFFRALKFGLNDKEATYYALKVTQY